jgi:transcriptional regulator with XRE-family HTH domain
MKVRNKVRQARLDLQSQTGKVWTMQDIAERIGISPLTLSNIEANRNQPNVATLRLLAHFYGVAMEDLLEEVEEEEPSS